MKRTVAWKVSCIFFLALLFLCISCATRIEYETVEVEVPVPVQVDISDIIDPVLAQRPDDSTIEIHPGPIYQLVDVVENSNAYLHGWEMWESYATALEDVIKAIQERFSVGE